MYKYTAHCLYISKAYVHYVVIEYVERVTDKCRQINWLSCEWGPHNTLHYFINPFCHPVGLN